MDKNIYVNMVSVCQQRCFASLAQKKPGRNFRWRENYFIILNYDRILELIQEHYIVCSEAKGSIYIQSNLS